MEARGATDRSLAHAAGYRSKTHITRLRHGATPGCGLTYAVRIAQHLGVDPNDLFVPEASEDSEQTGEVA